MRAVAEVNKYVSDSEPWKLKGDDERERLGTILHVIAQCVADLNTILSPFLPFSANAVDAVLGGAGDVQPMPRARGGRRPRRRSGLPDHHRRLHRRRPVGAPARSSRAPRSPSRRRCSPSSTRPSSTRSWPGSRRPEPRCPPATGQDERMTRRDAPAPVLRQAEADDDGQPLRDQRGQRGRLGRAADGGGAAEADGVQGAGHLLPRRPAHRAGVLVPGAPGDGPERRRTTCATPAEPPLGSFRKDFGQSLLRSTFHLSGPRAGGHRARSATRSWRSCAGSSTSRSRSTSTSRTRRPAPW